jgi:hypothetical protein
VVQGRLSRNAASTLGRHGRFEPFAQGCENAARSTAGNARTLKADKALPDVVEFKAAATVKNPFA